MRAHILDADRVNELLILGGVGVGVGICFFADRHGHLRGLLDAG